MRDDEFAKLARVYNLHKACAPILTDGIPLPDCFGDTPVSRGTENHRFITTGNHGWASRKISVTLNTALGLKDNGKKLRLLR